MSSRHPERSRGTGVGSGTISAPSHNTEAPA
jgi:hypothetical protein